MIATLITGASGGLGKEFAILSAKDHQNLVLVARSKEKLEILKQELERQYNVQVMTLDLDLSIVENIDKMMETLKHGDVHIDRLINNAGFGWFGAFHETGFIEEQSMIHLNIESLTALTKKILPLMVQNGKGSILNVASIAAFQAGPLMAVYYASKAYVLNFSLALREELCGTGVTVTCLCPGPTATGFEAGANLGASKLFKANLMDATSVAIIGYEAMKKEKPLVVAGTRNKILVFLTRLIPRTLAAKLAKYAQSPL